MAAMAAAYTDESSVEAFLQKVRRGIYPQPCRASGSRDKWHRGKLDEAIARRHGWTFNDAIREDVSELI